MRAIPSIGLLVLLTALPAAAQPTGLPDFHKVYQISGYVEYGTDPKQLAPEQLRVLADLAKEIIDSHKAGKPLLVALVVGHVDVAMKKPEGERAAFEQQVSEARALAARQALADELRKLPGGAEALNRQIAPITRGEGSKYRIYSPAKNEREMALNRRVEIYVTHAALPPAPPPPDPNDTLQTRIARLQQLVQTKGIPGAPAHRVKRAPCILNKLLQPGVVDSFVDGRATSPSGVGRFRQISNEGKVCFLPEWLGNYDTEKDPLPDTEMLKFVARIIPILEAGGFAPSQSDDQVLMLLNAIIERIDMGMNQVDLYIIQNTPEIYSGDAIRKRLQHMYRDNLDNPKNIYSCYK